MNGHEWGHLQLQAKKGGKRIQPDCYSTTDILLLLCYHLAALDGICELVDADEVRQSPLTCLDCIRRFYHVSLGFGKQ